MRAILAAVFTLLALPAGALADQSPSTDKKPTDGCLVVKDGKGTISVTARGGIFGRADFGRVTVEDLSPNDGKTVKVSGAEFAQVLGLGKTLYSSTTPFRFRATGNGPFRITISAIGIDLSAIGFGSATLSSTKLVDPGRYSTDADSFCAAKFQPLPSAPTKVSLGTLG